MSGKTKRILKKILSWSGLFFFGLAAYMLYHQLSKYEWADIQNALLAIPSRNLWYACIASFFGYVALSSYDFLALKYIKKACRMEMDFCRLYRLFCQQQRRPRYCIGRGYPLPLIHALEIPRNRHR